MQSRTSVFDRVTVDRMLVAATRVSWSLREDFDDPLPHTFQLEVGETGLPSADDWALVGSPANNVGQLLDTVHPRDLSITPTTHYRVKLVTPEGTYRSNPVSSEGRLHRHDWLRARAHARRETLRTRTEAGEIGWLYKRRKKTPRVTDNAVVDFVTGEVIRTMDTEGVGTDRIGGYFAPVEFWMGDLMPASARYARRDDNRGPVDDIQHTGRALGFPQLDHNDVWASATSDARYAIHAVRPLAQIRNIPIVVQVELRKLSPTDPIYDLVLPDVPPLQTCDRKEF